MGIGGNLSQNKGLTHSPKWLAPASPHPIQEESHSSHWTVFSDVNSFSCSSLEVPSSVYAEILRYLLIVERD